MEYLTYRDDLLPAIVAYWNASFRDRRNFWPITPEVFRARVVEKENQVERFEPEGLILAVDVPALNSGGEADRVEGVREEADAAPRVAGMIHVGMRSEAFCRVAFPDWKGGQQGYVAFLHVAPGDRGRGVGRRLWELGKTRLRDAARVVIDSQCLNPFYGNSEGPFTPFWGTPEGIGIDQTDETTLGFLGRRGHSQRMEAVQFELDLTSVGAGSSDPAKAALDHAGVTLRVSDDFYPELGVPWGTQVRYSARTRFRVFALMEGDVPRGLLCVYPLPEVGPGIYGIYETLIGDAYRGRGLGRWLLDEAMRDLRNAGGRRCDVLTIPGVSPAGLRLYITGGFRRVGSWAVY